MNYLVLIIIVFLFISLLSSLFTSPLFLFIVVGWIMYSLMRGGSRNNNRRTYYYSNNGFHGNQQTNQNTQQDNDPRVKNAIDVSFTEEEIH